jgi:hypothetical protein
MRADVSRTPGTFRSLALSACALAIGAACSTIPQARVALPEGRAFLATVPDSVDDVGFEPSITVADDGTPYVISFGFPAQLGEGEIPVTRPIGAPYLTTEDGQDAGAVLLSSLTADTQVWNRGAVAQPRETPGGVTVPFGPAAEPSLASLTPGTAAGADVAVEGSTIHAAWAADTGLWYGEGPDFEIERIEEGPGVGAPSVAAGADGPIVAYTVAGTQPEVRVAERTGERWTITTVATLGRCGQECPPPTGLAIVGGEPLVAVVDPDTRELLTARREGGAWTEEVAATGVVGGASLAAAGDVATISYYTAGNVAVATSAGGGWSSEEVGAVSAAPELSPTPSPSPTTGASPSGSPAPAPEPPIPTQPTTGVAVDGEGTVWVAWEDAEGIHLASSADGGFTEEDIGRTAGGATPSVAVSEDGSTVYLAWFDPQEGDLRVGISADLEGVLLAAPSPTPPPSTGGGDATCGEDGEIQLTVTAPAIAFDPTCLVAPAGEPFTITFNNDDTQNAHNVAVFDDPAAEPVAASELKVGSYTDELPVDAQEEGQFLFLCQAHPDQMRGTLAIVAAGGGGGGGGAGDGQGGGGEQGGGGGG